jgi:hypothetical protein
MKKYCDLKNQVEMDELPAKMETAVGVNTRPIIDDKSVQATGLRLLTVDAVPREGYRIDKLGYQDIDGKQARRIALHEVNLAAEKAAQEKAQADFAAMIEAREVAEKEKDMDFTTWPKHERFLLAMIQKPAEDTKKAYEEFE